MSNNNKVRYCPNCFGENIEDNTVCLPDGTINYYSYPTVYRGFVADEFRTNECPICGKPLVLMDITIDEWLFLTAHSKDIGFLLEMDKLKHNSIVDFTIKVEQLKNSAKQYYEQQRQQNIPKCPTCGSTNIKKISATKRWVSTGILGLGSSDLGKTMCCESCGAKW